MKLNAIVVIVYGLFVLIGGMVGFAKAHSIPSLVMGTAFAVGLVMSGAAMLKGIRWGFVLGCILVVALALFFGYRLVLTKSFMPAGMMCLMSLCVLVIMFVSRRMKFAS